MNGENVVFGGREGIRTLDLSVANAALSQLSYAPIRLVHTTLGKYNNGGRSAAKLVAVKR